MRYKFGVWDQIYLDLHLSLHTNKIKIIASISEEFDEKNQVR